MNSRLDVLKLQPALLAAIVPLVSCTLTALPALANDGGIAMGGSPALLTGHSSVSMKSELIKMKIGNGMVAVECNFVFENHGPACKVRMGFPDEGTGAYDPDEEDPDAMKRPPRTTFTSFKTFVNGIEVPFKLIRANEPGKFWRTKTVTFPARQTTLVRDVYTQNISGSVAGGFDSNTSVNAPQVSSHQHASYILRTGASWFGNIGKTEVVVQFTDPSTAKVSAISIPETLNLIAKKSKAAPKKLASNQSDQGSFLPQELDSKRNRFVVWRGFAAPAVEENGTIHFVRKDWKPTIKSDLDLYFNVHFASSR